MDSGFYNSSCIDITAAFLCDANWEMCPNSLYFQKNLQNDL